MKKDISLLLVEDSEEDATWIRMALRKAETADFKVDHAEWLASAITAIGAKSYDVVLLDLTLPDSHGIDTLVSFMEAAPHLPVIVLTGYDDMDTAKRCMKYGAQDYQLKGDVQPGPLERSIVYAIERRRRDLVGKRLIRKSISQFTAADESQPAILALIKEHLKTVPAAIYEIVDYVGKNAPQCRDDIDQIIESHNLTEALREMREMVRASEPPPSLAKGPRALADRTIRSMTPPNFKLDPATAEESLAEALEDLTAPLDEEEKAHG